MYSHEIDKIIKENNHQLPASVYMEISDVNNSPQIERVKYEPCSDSFSMWTKDGWCWNFMVYRD